MRLISSKNLKDGDIIARDIVSHDGGILLRHNTRFKEVFKAKLIERNISEVYIDDEISAGIEPRSLLDSSSKQAITQDIKEQFQKLQNSMEIDTEVLSQVASLLIEALSEKEMIIELEDLRTNDLYTYEHCISVAIMASLVCNRLQINQQQKQEIIMGALIHDIGKMMVPKSILNKAGALTENEYEIVKSHTEIGYKLIKDNLALSAITKLAVLCHHEREDGSGYPLGKGKELHIGTKIVAGCDLYHALISDRCYRQGLPINEVIAIGQREPINPEVREIIENLFAYYPVGALVKLNDGSIAIVEQNFCADVKRPIVRVVDRETKNTYKLNLQKETRYYIVNRYQGNL